MLKISENGRYFNQNDGLGTEKPFFWLGDTAWLLFQRLSLDQTKVYFENRKFRNFNVIQAVLVHNMNVEDQTLENDALIDGDFSKINLKCPYWNKIDRVIDLAEENGLYMGLLPVWGSMVKKGYLTEANAEAYGKFLAEKFGKRKNVVWILGGDIRGNVGTEVWDIVGKTLKQYSSEQLITFHPFGRTSSSMWFSDREWIDFNMFQSGHRRYDQCSLGHWDDNSNAEDFFGEDNWKYVERDLKSGINKPILDGEPSYEDIPQGLHGFDEPKWQAKDIRRYAYWSVFQGACGHTYGSNAVMQFYSESVSDPGYNVSEYWSDAIKSPGAMHMKHMYNLMNMFDFQNANHSDKIVSNEGYSKHDRITCLCGKGFTLIYNYTGREFSIDIQELGFSPNWYKWYDPTSGKFANCGFDINKSGDIKTPPNSLGETDMVLVLSNKTI